MNVSCTVLTPSACAHRWSVWCNPQQPSISSTPRPSLSRWAAPRLRHSLPLRLPQQLVQWRQQAALWVWRHTLHIPRQQTGPQGYCSHRRHRWLLKQVRRASPQSGLLWAASVLLRESLMLLPWVWSLRPHVCVVMEHACLARQQLPCSSCPAVLLAPCTPVPDLHVQGLS